MNEEAWDTVIAIGDVHGNLKDLEQLWSALQAYVGEERWPRALVIFLGDLNDRGPDTKGVIDFCLGVQQERGAGVRFLVGNHDFGFAGFIGALPVDEDHVVDLGATRSTRWSHGFYEHAPEPLHYQALRWGGSHVYSAGPTFASYGCRQSRVLGRNAAQCEAARHAFAAAVPQAHRAFLQRMEWIVDVPVSFGPGRLLAVHAGLDPETPLEPQLQGLKARHPMCSAIHQNKDPGRIAALSGRGDVLALHPDLQGNAIVVSGHHGWTEAVETDRYVVDTSGGLPSDERPLHALVLPDEMLVGSRSAPVVPIHDLYSGE